MSAGMEGIMEGYLKSVLEQWRERQKGRHPLANMKYIFRRTAITERQ